MTRHRARTYGSIRLAEDGAVWEMTAVEPHVAIRLKHLFPRIPKWESERFVLPNDPLHCADLAWFVLRYPMAISEADEARLLGGRDRFEANVAEMERILTPDWRPPAYLGLQPGMAVRGYQGQAIEIWHRRKGLLVADAVGLGKTYVAGGALLKEGVLPAAVVVQTHLQRQWEEKLTEFTTLRCHRIKKASPYNLPDADVYIFRYSQLIGWPDFFRQGFFKAVFYDEVQELRTGLVSGKGIAAKALSDSVEWRCGLSATPIYGYGSEIYNVMGFIDASVLGAHDDFAREWLRHDGRLKDPKALGTYLREQHVYIRRTKDDVGQDMPPVNRITETVDWDQKTLDNVEDIARSLAIRSVTGTYLERGQAARELDARVRHATGVAKAKGVAQFVRILLEADEPVLLVGWHRDVYDVWLKELADFNPMLYTGTESPTQKDRVKRAAMTGETNLMILSLRSGAGLDGLQHRFSTVVFGELDWSHGIHDQVIGRLFREGQEHQVMAIFLVSEEGSDPVMIDVLGLKASEARGVIDPNLDVEVVETDPDNLRKLAERFLDARARQQIADIQDAQAQAKAAAEGQANRRGEAA